MIRRFTTPLVRVTVAKDLSEADEIFVTFSQSQSYVTKVKKDMQITYDEDTTTILTRLTQPETGLFSEREPLTVQANWIQGDTRDASGTKKVYLGSQTLREVKNNG